MLPSQKLGGKKFKNLLVSEFQNEKNFISCSAQESQTSSCIDQETEISNDGFLDEFGE